ncbi:hypothetical protein [Microbacterium oxydans]|uniref:hypothetical protein n=1 Tax=Microbacterium oxydans TaxID=82380 RepID=UPI0022B1991D|nr:hypothetical protein [Microbacterium oxydans]MCZ4302696.1 hypothetical protein [Microbacterium oxydans]
MTRRIRSFHVRGAIPGLVIRLLVVALVWGGAVVLIPFPLWRGVALVAAVAAVVVPRSLAAWVAAACLVFGVILSEPAPGRTALAVFLVPAVHVLASVSLVVPSSSRLAIAALAPTLSRFLTVQLLSQPIVYGMWLLVPATFDRGAAWLAPLAAVALLIGVLLALRAVKRTDDPRRRRPATMSGRATGRSSGADVGGPS